MTEAEVIEGMLELLNSPERWCKDLLYDTHADSYCLMGAMHKVMTGRHQWPQFRYVADEPERKVYKEVIGLIAAAIPDSDVSGGYDDHECDIVQFNNDRRTEYEDVRLVLKEALERAS